MDRSSRIAIIGGSLVGPLAELLARGRGFTNVTTYEAARQSRPQSGGIIGIREWNTPVLASVGIPASEVTAYPGAEVTTYDLRNAEIVGLRDSRLYPGISTGWDLLHTAVSSRVDIRYGHKVTAIRPTFTGAELVFADGVTAEFDLVVFADGRKSTGRQLLDPGRALRYQGYLVWRGLREHIGPAPVGFERYRDDLAGVLFSITEPIQIGAHAGESDWTLYHNLSEVEYTRTAGASPTERAFMLPSQVTLRARQVMTGVADRYLPARFADTIKATSQIMAVPINDVRLPDRAFFPVGGGHAVLVSDALAGVRPHAGRGVNNGIEQVALLFEHLASMDVRRALSSWQAEILPRLPEWVDLGIGRATRNGLGVRAA